MMNLFSRMCSKFIFVWEIMTGGRPFVLFSSESQQRNHKRVFNRKIIYIYTADFAAA